MAYSRKLLDYFENPRCAGELPDANAIAEVANPICGDVMKIWLKVADNRILDARFKTQGCSAAIATSSYSRPVRSQRKKLPKRWVDCHPPRCTALCLHPTRFAQP